MDGSLGTTHFASDGRLDAESSALFADHILCVGLLLTILLAAKRALTAWLHARAIAGEVWRRRGLQPGTILLPGAAEAADDEPEPPAGGAPTPFIELTIEERGREYSSKNGSHYIRWVESARALKARPFVLRTDGGERIRIEPGDRIDLTDRLEDLVPRPPGRSTRQRVARIVLGEKIWVRGVLTTATRELDRGPYRGGDGARYVIRPPAREALYLSSQPVDAEYLAEARFRALFAALFTLLLLLCEVGFFADYHALSRRGVAGDAEVINRRAYTTTSKNSTTHHYLVQLKYFAAGESYVEEQHTNASAYGSLVPSSHVPIVYLPRKPSVMQLGGLAELGVESGAVFVGFLLWVFQAVAAYTRRPWWRRKKVVENEDGRL